MSNKLLYINGQLVDLYPDTVIAQTLQAFEVGALGSVRANYTNQIRIPQTPTNRRAFGFADDSKSSTDAPYTSYSARYVENGIEIIRNGTVSLKDSNKEFKLNILSGPIGFFDFIKTRKLWDLDTLDLNSAWDDSDRDAVRNTTTGIVSPLIDDGIITYDGVTPAIVHTGSVAKHPWIYYHTVIAKIFEDAGFEKSGAIFSDEKYLKLAMPLKTAYSAKFVEAKMFHASAPGTQVIVDPASYTAVTFNNVSSSGDDGFYNGTSAYVVANSDTSERYFRIAFRTMVTITVSGGTVNMDLRRQDFPAAAVGFAGTPHIGVGSGTYYMGGSINAENGDIVTVGIIKNSGTPTITITNATFETVAGIVEQVPYPDYVYFNHLFEDINQIDIIKDFSVRFNVKMIERNGTIICKTMDEILADADSAIDWTSKRASDKNKLQYAYNGLARSNFMTYPTDGYVENATDDFGKGVFLVANENINETQTIYGSIFAMSEMIVFDDRIFVARIGVGADVDSLGIRLLYLRQNNTASEPNSEVIYNITSRDDYKVAYFIDPRQTNSMHWQFFIDNYYAGLVSKLQKAKVVNRDYRLTDVDIHTFDQLKPIYDNGEMFIVTKINNYISGQMTDVELFKIN